MRTSTGALADAGPAPHAAAELSLPRQHGAWSVLLVGFLLGAGAVGSPGLPALLLLVAIVSGFVARHALAAGLRLPTGDPRRGRLVPSGALGGVAALLLGGLVVALYGRWLLVPLGAVVVVMAALSTLLEWKHQDRTAWGEWLNLLGLSLVTPLGAYAATGILDARTWALYALAALFFTASVFHVRYLARCRSASTGPLPGRLRAGSASLAYHLGALCAASALALAGLVPPLAALALVPTAGKALCAVCRRQSGPLSIRRVGLLELAHSLLFPALVILAYRLR